MGARPLLTAVGWTVLLALLATRPAPAGAMSLDLEGDQAVLSGPVTGDECARLAGLLEHNPVRTVVLTQSNGGDANAGYCVGELIRRHQLDTVIRGNCSSSCSRMWLGGVSRTLPGQLLACRAARQLRRGWPPAACCAGAPAGVDPTIRSGRSAAHAAMDDPAQQWADDALLQ
jgi:hypothetical protein